MSESLEEEKSGLETCALPEAPEIHHAATVNQLIP